MPKETETLPDDFEDTPEEPCPEGDETDEKIPGEPPEEEI
jgi:hypothetical protein